MNGHMIWKDKRIPVRDVKEGPRMDFEGVRDGWDATTDDAIASRMFYPADLFTFEPAEGTGQPTNHENGRGGGYPPCATCGETVYLTVSGAWRHVDRDYAHAAFPNRESRAEPKHTESCAERCNHCQVCGDSILYGSRCPDHYQGADRENGSEHA